MVAGVKASRQDWMIMGRLVKRQDIGDKVPSEEAWKAPNGKYYSSEEAYEQIQKNALFWKMSLELLSDYMEYQSNMKFPTIIPKKIKEFEVYGYDVVYDTLLQEEKPIRTALQTKHFSTENGKAAYIMAIVQNNIMDVYKKKIAEKKRRSKEKQTTEFSDSKNIIIGNTKSKSNVSNLLGDL